MSTGQGAMMRWSAKSACKASWENNENEAGMWKHGKNMQIGEAHDEFWVKRESMDKKRMKMKCTMQEMMREDCCC